jgi:hypothetical protein
VSFAEVTENSKMFQKLCLGLLNWLVAKQVFHIKARHVDFSKWVKDNIDININKIVPVLN